MSSQATEIHKELGNEIKKLDATWQNAKEDTFKQSQAEKLVSKKIRDFIEKKYPDEFKSIR